MSTRPAFKINGNVYVSAGIVFLRRTKHGIEYMMQQIKYDDPKWIRDWSWEDFGGKSEPKDRSIFAVAYRECLEELNSVISPQLLLTLLHNRKKTRRLLYPQSKYVLFLIDVTDTKLDIDPKICGEMETHTGIKRHVQWLTKQQLHKEFASNNVTPRINQRILGKPRRVRLS